MDEREVEASLKNMIEVQLKRRGITDGRVLNCMRKVKRHWFVPRQMRPFAYEDRPLPIGEGQTISQPYMVGLMTQTLNPKENERILEIGTGSGWQTSILACLCKEVYTVERIFGLYERAYQVINKLGITNVFFKVGDGSLGWDEHSPYDGIMVTCACPQIPWSFKKQVSVGGRIILPLGGRFSQDLILARKISEDKFEEEYICGCVFVPLIGECGFQS